MKKSKEVKLLKDLIIEPSDSDRSINSDSKEKQTIPKREGFTIVKKKNVPEKPIAPASTPRDNSKMSLDQFGSVSEALRTIKNKLQKQMDKNNG
jgi:hypothetical protein